VYSSDSLAAPIGLALSYLPGVRVIFHEHDTPEIPGHAVFGRMCVAARSRLARRAALVIAPNAERARRLRNGVARGGAVQTVWNCPLRSEVREARDRDGRALRLIFQGSLVPERGAMTMVRALALLPSEVEFVVVGYETLGSPGFVERLRDEARRLGVAERMRLAGALPHADAMALCATCDLGLAIASAVAVDDNLRTLAGASNKVFEYLACGVVPIVPDTEEWRDDFVDPGFAISCDPDSPAALANVIGICVADRDALRERGERGRQRILDDWNYETAFAPVLRTICETALVAAGRVPASKAAPSSVAAR
jgi:glycosyltransferase involved in cell wall biosynthesis